MADSSQEVAKAVEEAVPKDENKDTVIASQDVAQQQSTQTETPVNNVNNNPKEGEGEVQQLKTLLNGRENEVATLKQRIHTLETELAAALLQPKNGGNHNELLGTLKNQHDELLSRAKGMIFDKTKVVKNQELQIEALQSQVSSLKDVASITKDLLEIRNTEIKHLEGRLQDMENCFKCERERQNLILKKAETGATINDSLKKEYDTQLALFKELREKYDARVAALVEENRLLNERIGRTPSVPEEIVE